MLKGAQCSVRGLTTMNWGSSCSYGFIPIYTCLLGLLCHGAVSMYLRHQNDPKIVGSNLGGVETLDA